MEIRRARAPPLPSDRGWRARSGRTARPASPCRSPPCPRSARRGQGGPRDRPRAFPLRRAHGRPANRHDGDGARQAAHRLQEVRRSRPSSCELGLERARRIEPALDRRPNGRGDLVFDAVGVDDGAAPRLGGGDVEERPPEGQVKRQSLRFEPVGRPRLPSLGGPLETDFRVEIEDQGQVRPIRAHRKPLERGDELRRQIPGRALVGPGRIRRTGRKQPRRRCASAGRIVLSR